VEIRDCEIVQQLSGEAGPACTDAEYTASQQQFQSCSQRVMGAGLEADQRCRALAAITSKCSAHLTRCLAQQDVTSMVEGYIKLYTDRFMANNESQYFNCTEEVDFDETQENSDETQEDSDETPEDTTVTSEDSDVPLSTPVNDLISPKSLYENLKADGDSEQYVQDQPFNYELERNSAENIQCVLSLFALCCLVFALK